MSCVWRTCYFSQREDKVCSRQIGGYQQGVLLLILIKTNKQKSKIFSLAVASEGSHILEAGISHHTLASHYWQSALSNLYSMPMATQKGAVVPQECTLGVYFFLDSLRSSLEVSFLVLLLEFQLLEFFLGRFKDSIDLSGMQLWVSKYGRCWNTGILPSSPFIHPHPSPNYSLQ